MIHDSISEMLVRVTGHSAAEWVHWHKTSEMCILIVYTGLGPSYVVIMR